MPLLALGINHKTAPVAVREKVAFAPERLNSALREVRNIAQIPEVAILSTCNRMEVYGNHLEEGFGHLVDWLSRYHQVSRRDIDSCLYVHTNQDAVKHVMRVASGLDSLVLGEPQILGQMKQAYSSAADAGTLGACLSRLFQQTFSVAKQVRTDTAIGSSAVSVAYAAVNLSRHIFTDLSKTTALFVGAGETIELAARHLANLGVKRMIVANRTVARAQELAQTFDGAQAISLSQIPEVLHQADILVASTASSLPILGKGVVESALKQRRRKPMFMVDLAVPRDIEPQVGDLEDVYLYTVDDLQEVIQENLRTRSEAAEEAQDIIEVHSDHFMNWMKSQNVVDTLRGFRDKHENTRVQELQRALNLINQGQDPELVLTQFSKRLTNKFLHEPTLDLRRAGANEDNQHIEQFRQVFGLEKE
ncbi:MAG: glutamyl-tRNA reductase [Pseudomonadota bacterium]